MKDSAFTKIKKLFSKPHFGYLCSIWANDSSP